MQGGFINYSGSYCDPNSGPNQAARRAVSPSRSRGVQVHRAPHSSHRMPTVTPAIVSPALAIVCHHNPVHRAPNPSHRIPNLAHRVHNSIPHPNRNLSATNLTLLHLTFVLDPNPDAKQHTGGIMFFGLVRPSGLERTEFM